MPTPIILECDRGHDDAIALLLTLASPDLDVLDGSEPPEQTVEIDPHADAVEFIARTLRSRERRVTLVVTGGAAS